MICSRPSRASSSRCRKVCKPGRIRRVDRVGSSFSSFGLALHPIRSKQIYHFSKDERDKEELRIVGLELCGVMVLLRFPYRSTISRASGEEKVARKRRSRIKTLCSPWSLPRHFPKSCRVVYILHRSGGGILFVVEFSFRWSFRKLIRHRHAVQAGRVQDLRWQSCQVYTLAANLACWWLGSIAQRSAAVKTKDKRQEDGLCEEAQLRYRGHTEVSNCISSVLCFGKRSDGEKIERPPEDGILGRDPYDFLNPSLGRAGRAEF
ncbi:hypothetical protein V8F33_002104 [Rhypophila sp. PSN 637]